MFKHGATEGKVDMWCYDESLEDFSKDAVLLDLWVMEQVEALFRNASSNPTLRQQLEQKGNVFFLHLLGLDTTGHTYRPNGPEYHRNIVMVDKIVRKVNAVFDTFFNELDGAHSRTAFVFTADHGMSNIGYDMQLAVVCR